MRVRAAVLIEAAKTVLPAAAACCQDEGEGRESLTGMGFPFSSNRQERRGGARRDGEGHSLCRFSGAIYM